MSDLEYFDVMILEINGRRREAELMTWDADRSEGMLHQHFGLECVSREPGFPCWTAPGLPGYFNTPREAVAAMTKTG